MIPLKVHRQKIRSLGSNYRFPWRWHYFTDATGHTPLGAETRLEEYSLTALRRTAKQKGYRLTPSWEQSWGR